MDIHKDALEGQAYWFANRAGSCHGDKGPDIDVDRNLVCNHKSLNTYAPHPDKDREVYLNLSCGYYTWINLS